MKKPLCCNQQTIQIASIKPLQNIGSRKHAVFLARFCLACLLQQRAGYRFTSPIRLLKKQACGQGRMLVSH
jgi:hypothetical protein